MSSRQLSDLLAARFIHWLSGLVYLHSSLMLYLLTCWNFKVFFESHPLPKAGAARPPATSQRRQRVGWGCLVRQTTKFI